MMEQLIDMELVKVIRDELCKYQQWLDAFIDPRVPTDEAVRLRAISAQTEARKTVNILNDMLQHAR